MSANRRPGRQSWHLHRPEKHELGRGHCVLAFCQVPFRSAVAEVSANQKPGQPSWFSDRLEKHKLGRAH